MGLKELLHKAKLSPEEVKRLDEEAEREVSARVDAELKKHREEEEQKRVDEAAKEQEALKKRLDMAKRTLKALGRSDMDDPDKEVDMDEPMSPEAMMARIKELEEQIRVLTEAKADADKTAEEEAKRADEETLRLAKAIAEARGAANVDEEAKRIAALGRPTVDELLKVTPAPRADSLLLGLTGRIDTARRADEEAQPIVARLDESMPNRPQVAFTVRDWSPFQQEVKA